jgi:DNA-binding transcriptional ArsR family regulator
MCYRSKMTITVDMAAAAALVGDPARANILAALMDCRAHTATELALIAGVAPPTASGHLAKLARARMVGVVAQGRHRYYRLASNDVARMLEAIMTFASERPTNDRRATPRIDPALRRARTCYDHIAGEFGVAIADRLVASGAVTLAADSAIVTDGGHRMLRKAGLLLDSSGRSRRPGCRPCLDWSERRPHLAGVLGSAILDHALRSGLVRRREEGRALDVTDDIAKVLAKLGFH